MVNSSRLYDMLGFEMNMHMSEADMMLSDKRTFERFYRTHSAGLRRFIGFKIDSSDDAEEVLQDVFFSFLEALRDFQGKSSVRTFLYSIARNKIIDYYRRKKIKSVVFSSTPHLESLVSTLFIPEETFNHTILKENIARVMRKILPHYRQILVDKYDLGLSVHAIAQKCSITVKSAEAKLFRARKAFVKAFAQM